MFNAVFSRMLSIWNENKQRFIVSKDRVILNVWTRRSSMDYLQYLKFEFVQYTFHGGFLLCCFLVMPFICKTGQYNKWHTNWTEIDDYCFRLNVMFGLADFLSMLLMRILLSLAMGGFVSKLQNYAYYTVVGFLFLAIIFLKVEASIELLVNRNYIHLF